MSVFALRPRELRQVPLAAAEATHLSRDDVSRVLIACAVALILSVALVFSLLTLPEAPQNGPVAAPHVVKPAWVEIQKPFRLFALNAPEWGREPAYSAERHRDGGGRRDHLIFGTFGTRAWLLVTLYRRGEEGADPTPFFADVARRAAPAELAIARTGQPRSLPARLGSFDVADFTLAGTAGASGQSTSCLGFRSADRRILEIGGFACGTPGNPIDRARLACTLDRIDLISAGDDTELRAFFTGAAGQLGAACSKPPAEAQTTGPAKPTPGFIVLR
ncbi:MAG: hypothetical protein QOH65_2872 [Methylobacteriaceae bacterium]|jgi:hypothetical protein|nr:hypothetical protein [Methylobacteriaceae bacterium]